MLDFCRRYISGRLFWAYLGVALLSSLLSLVGPFLSGDVVNLLAYGGDHVFGPAICCCIGVACTLGLRSLLTYCSDMLYIDLQSHAGFSLNAETLEHVKKLPQSFFRGFDSAYLTQQINHDSNDLVIFVINSAVQVTSNALSLSIVFVVLACLNLRLCLVCFALAIVGAALYLFSRDKLFSKSYDVQEQSAKFFSALQDQLDMAQFIRRHALFEQFRSRLTSSFDKLYPVVKENQATGSRFTLINSLAAAVAHGCLLMVGTVEVLNGRLSPGYLVTAIGYYSTLSGAIQFLLSWGKEYQTNRVCYERLKKIWDLPEEEDGGCVPDAIGRISFTSVVLRYPGADRCSLRLGDCTFERGFLYGVAGPNGSGKSSMLSVLLGLYPEDTKGSIRYNDNLLHEINRCELRKKRMGVTEQEPPILNMTIRDNLTLLGGEVNEEELRRLIDSLGLRTLISSSANGLDTVIEDGGDGVSGGEKQKIAIVRQLVKNPDVMLFDEPTSALDAESKRGLIGLLEEKKSEHIIIVVTHDRELLEACDEVIEMPGER